MYRVNLEIFCYLAQGSLFGRPSATIFYAFQYNKNGRNERLFDTMLFKMMKKWEKIVFYEFNISFALIFRKWKMVLNNLILGIPN